MPTVADVTPLRDALAHLRSGEPLRHGPLTVVPLTAGPGPEPDWLTLTEAGAAVIIEEVSQAGQVPTLRVTNTADRPVLLLDGEELVGAKQNRVLNTSVLVARGARLDIPVSCVEQGRWAYKSARFAAAGASLYASARAKKAARVSESLRARGGHASDQGEVWAAMSSMAAAHQVESPTGAMRDFYERYEQDIAAARATLAPQPGQAGALVFLGTRWIGLDLLASPGLFARAWPRLCAGYAAEAVGAKGKEAAEPDPRVVLARLRRAPVEDAPAVGLGREHRMAGGHVAGAALVVDDLVAHLMAFPAPPAYR
jgi:hypothetical protein